LDEEEAKNDLDDQGDVLHKGIHINMKRRVQRIRKDTESSRSNNSLTETASIGFYKSDIRLSVESELLGSTIPLSESELVTPSGEYVPTWEPNYAFSFPVSKFLVTKVFSSDLVQGDFQNMQKFAEGSNSDIFIATYHSNQVIIKMLKNRLRNSRLPLQELNLEHGMLARLSHPNVIKILGAGDAPQKFIVVEYLGGGTLQQLLHPPKENDRKSPAVLNFPSIFKKKCTLPLDRSLRIARDIAVALTYLHDCCEGATIIHRG
jgi:hypothetical protein